MATCGGILGVLAHIKEPSKPLPVQPKESEALSRLNGLTDSAKLYNFYLSNPAIMEELMRYKRDIVSANAYTYKNLLDYNDKMSTLLIKLDDLSAWCTDPFLL